MTQFVAIWKGKAFLDSSTFETNDTSYISAWKSSSLRSNVSWQKLRLQTDSMHLIWILSRARSKCCYLTCFNEHPFTWTAHAMLKYFYSRDPVTFIHRNFAEFLFLIYFLLFIFLFAFFFSFYNSMHRNNPRLGLNIESIIKWTVVSV